MYLLYVAVLPQLLLSLPLSLLNIHHHCQISVTALTFSTITATIAVTISTTITTNTTIATTTSRMNVLTCAG
ncbi:hypothetical protein E2C01_094936 [Portunus trituberculatus]|uniref:Uncharacterized protein n=1 Tax=Portunus trituberculatus TaxID=210409 RepID=A0A5B7K285_PORTR|nr:hypothetical protein [Portunus trituberculatus]